MRRAMAVLGVAAMAVLVLGSVALATHSRPSGGTPLNLPLLTAHLPCSSPDTTHAAPLAYGSCTSPVSESAIVSTGPTGAGQGALRMDARCSNAQVPPCPAPGDQEDDGVMVSTTDVRCKIGGVPGCAAAGADYVGRLAAQLTVRITDHANPAPCATGSGNPPCVPGTVRDTVLSIPFQCADNGNINGANCVLGTSLDALEPGTVTELQRQAIELLSFRVVDQGPDGSLTPSAVDDPLGLGCPLVCGSGDETVFQRAGLFNP